MLIDLIALAVGVAVFLIVLGLWPPRAGPPRHRGPGEAGGHDFKGSQRGVPPLPRPFGAHRFHVTLSSGQI